MKTVINKESAEQSQGHDAYLSGLGHGSPKKPFLDGWLTGFYQNKDRQDAITSRRIQSKSIRAVRRRVRKNKK